MKVKYIAVPVSERLPMNGKCIIGVKMEPQSSTNGKAFPENILLEEVPDHSEEMLSLLEECLGKLPINTDYQVTFYRKVEQLILKIKE
ncbi:hypothetical protein HZQ15_18780 [Elizabethkingia anophelis]|nr:hypothetical protein [Elizabethkingia anophelis]MCT4042844.1 hypothetical protein [Elizabethkingia anophelis]